MNSQFITSKHTDYANLVSILSLSLIHILIWPWSYSLSILVHLGHPEHIHHVIYTMCPSWPHSLFISCVYLWIYRYLYKLFTLNTQIIHTRCPAFRTKLIYTMKSCWTHRLFIPLIQLEHTSPVFTSNIQSTCIMCLPSVHTLTLILSMSGGFRELIVLLYTLNTQFTYLMFNLYQTYICIYL